MPHRRHRHIEPLLKQLMGMSPLVGILGHRQVGKTTLLEALAKHYFTMDAASELLEAQRFPAQYLQRRAASYVAIDECQNAPELFPALKEWVRTHPRPGQFLLSGSVRFTSRKAIQESLTGRIVNLELLPMLISELCSQPLPDFWRKMVQSADFDRSTVSSLHANKREAAISTYFQNGGLPGICFIKNAAFRERKLDSQLETIIDRDLRKVVPTNIAYSQLRRLLQVLANLQGELFSWSDIKKETEISIPTLKKILYGLEAVFILRTVIVEGDVKGPVYFCEDLGEASFLRTREFTWVDKCTHFLMIHIRGELSYGFSTPFRIFQYRTRAGVCVPVALQVKQNYLGVIPIENEQPSRSETAAGESFLKKYNRSKVLFVKAKGTVKRIDDRRLVLPLHYTV